MQKIKDMIVNSRVWRSFFRHGFPDNPLDRSLIMTTNVFFHLHPVKISRKSLKWSYSLGLGLITAIVFGSLSITGILLMFYYVPSVERAYSYIIILQTEVPFGQLLRNLHRWGAHLMVIAAVLHMAQSLLHRSLQTASRIQLGGWRGFAAAHIGSQFHRLPAPLGSTRLLGHHRWYQCGFVCPRSGRHYEIHFDWWARSWAGIIDSLLQPARNDRPSRDFADHIFAYVAGAKRWRSGCTGSPGSE